MDSLFILVPAALALGLLALAAFLWALRNGQYDDPEGSAGRILFDAPRDLREMDGVRLRPSPLLRAPAPFPCRSAP